MVDVRGASGLADAGRRWRARSLVVAEATARAVRQSPVSVGLVLATWLLGLGTRSVLDRPSTALRGTVLFSVADSWTHPLSLAASVFWPTGLRGYLLSSVAVLGLGIFVERRLGRARYAAALVVTHVGALLTVAAAAAAVPLLWPGAGAYVTGLHYGGPWCAVVGASFAATGGLTALWRRRIRVGGLALLTTGLLYSGGAVAMMTMTAAVIGWALGHRWHRRGIIGTRRGTAVAAGGAVGSLQEARTLGALIVAATATGPLLAALNPAANGPLAVTAYLMAPMRGARADVVAQLCAEAPSSPACTLGGLHLHQGLGTSLLAALPAVLLLLAAVGMRRGRRLAWVAAIVLQCVLVVEITAAYLLTLNDGATIPASTAANDEQPSTVLTGLLLPVLVPLTVSLVALVLGRDLYTVREPARAVGRLATRLGALFAAAALGYVALALLVPSQWTPPPSAATLLLDVPRRFVPLEMVLGVVPNHHPTGPIARLLVEWWGVAFWAAVIGVLVHDVRQVTVLKDEGRTAAQAVLRAHGGGPIAWMGMWAGNSYWFDTTGTSYVPYRVVHKVALTTGDPVGPPSDRAEALRSFTAFCQSAGWVPCFYSVSADLQSMAAAQGWHSLQIAEEPYLRLGQIALTGKAFQDLRSAFNAARRAGIEVRWIDYGTASATIVSQVHAISEDWVTRQALPEMGFTLGGLDQLADPNVRCSIVVDPDGRIHAVASWLPIYTAGAVTGWTLDFMRRRQDGFTRSIDLLIAQAILDLQAEGFTTLSLSGAPLARNTPTASRAGSPGSPGSPQQGLPVEVKGLDRLLTVLGARLEPVYGFRSLLRFKAKFAPQYRPVYLLYPDPAALPAIARAVTRAYVPDATLATMFRVLQRVNLQRSAAHTRLHRGVSDTRGTPAPDHEPASPTGAWPPALLGHIWAVGSGWAQVAARNVRSMRVLIAEDAPRLAQLLRRGLQDDGHAVDVTGTGTDALWLGQENPYDAILLDVMLPGLTGFEVCQRLRAARCSVPVIMLTARDSVEDRVRGLDLGADDYLTKPFSFTELTARLRAVTRREHPPRPNVLTFDDLTLDPVSFRVWRGDVEISLSVKEFALLEYLMRAPGTVRTRTEILDHVWDFAYDGVSNVVDQYVRYLRRKIDRPFRRHDLQTVRGRGYRLGGLGADGGPAAVGTGPAERGATAGQTGALTGNR